MDSLFKSFTVPPRCTESGVICKPIDDIKDTISLATHQFYPEVWREGLRFLDLKSKIIIIFIDRHPMAWQHSPIQPASHRQTHTHKGKQTYVLTLKHTHTHTHTCRNTNIRTHSHIDSEIQTADLPQLKWNRERGPSAPRWGVCGQGPGAWTCTPRCLGLGSGSPECRGSYTPSESPGSLQGTTEGERSLLLSLRTSEQHLETMIIFWVTFWKRFTVQILPRRHLIIKIWSLPILLIF